MKSLNHSKRFPGGRTILLVLLALSLLLSVSAASAAGSVAAGDMIGTVTIRGTFNNGNARIVRVMPNPDSDIVTRVYDGEQYPCYDIAIGPGHREWYKILVSEGWGWISSGVADFRSNGSGGSASSRPVPTVVPSEDRIGTVTVRGTFVNSDARIVRAIPNADGDIVTRVFDGERYPCYGVAIGPGHRQWYKILVSEGWGWISSGVSVLNYD